MTATINFAVERARCTRCGECIADCPVRIITPDEAGWPRIAADDEADCMQCQHCLAVCPTGAVSIMGKDPAHSLPIDPALLPTPSQMALLMRSRRTVRQYRAENVDAGLLRDILATVAHAPTGVNARRLTFRVVDDIETMGRIRETVYQAVLAAEEASTLPAGAAYMHSVASRFYSQRRDILFRGAPHALVVSAPPGTPCGPEDVTLALAYFELLAQSAGLGTVWWGLLKMALEALPELKGLFGLPADHTYYAMLFGLPAVRYARTVQRDDAATVITVPTPQEG